MRLLARREHSAKELRQKLRSKGLCHQDVEHVLADLEAERLQDDRRFVDAYVRARRGKGYGPLRIQQELRERGIDDETAAAFVESGDGAWVDLAVKVRSKRFGSDSPGDERERQRQWRFLHYRGFTSGQIKAAFKANE